MERLYRFEHLKKILISAVIFIPLIMGGISGIVGYGEKVGLIVSVLLLVFTWRQTNGKIILPRGFKLFALFLVFLLFNISWSGHKAGTREYFVNFVTGGLLWITTFNLKEIFLPILDKLVVLIGIFFGAFFFIIYFFGINVIDNGWSFFSYNPVSNHLHIGDLWAIIAVILTFYLQEKFRWRILPLLVVALSIIAMSLSRSAYLAFGIGLLFLIFQRKKPGVLAKILVIFIPTLFFFAGISKPIFSERPYFIQGLKGLISYPFGVGMGNFFEISRRFYETKLTTVAHNLILEVFTGMGVLGLVFLGWLIKIVLEILRAKDKPGLVYRAVFFALLANFMFDTTYSIPSMLWLWFASLGLAQPTRSES